MSIIDSLIAGSIIVTTPSRRLLSNRYQRAVSFSLPAAESLGHNVKMFKTFFVAKTVRYASIQELHFFIIIYCNK